MKILTSLLLTIGISISALHAQALINIASKRGGKTETIKGAFVPGLSSDILFIAQNGKDYTISVRPEKKSEGPLSFQVIDARTNEIVYDSQRGDAVSGSTELPQVEESGTYRFTCYRTQKYIVRVSAECNGMCESQASDPQAADEEEMIWVEVELEKTPTPKLGF